MLNWVRLETTNNVSLTPADRWKLISCFRVSADQQLPVSVMTLGLIYQPGYLTCAINLHVKVFMGLEAHYYNFSVLNLLCIGCRKKLEETSGFFYINIYKCGQNCPRLSSCWCLQSWDRSRMHMKMLRYIQYLAVNTLHYSSANLCTCSHF